MARELEVQVRCAGQGSMNIELNIGYSVASWLANKWRRLTSVHIYLARTKERPLRLSPLAHMYAVLGCNCLRCSLLTLIVSLFNSDTRSSHVDPRSQYQRPSQPDQVAGEALVLTQMPLAHTHLSITQHHSRL